ncbi:K+-sensing histidine kinase KdpD [Bradyrhizobium huanghuaihaiense]|uniref:Two-component system sensor histidine kinase AdeS n=1 Tax=Bradyrhizobium huanghuaihaiense TaxID=990078 RepID=A0A562RX04_9BRAD|nr:hypothetical protein [Bradyrhizobium huanghuaihaiense]TWI72850.1 two-component system sensor histidine kinase AdeS [Bradyrhizobium huanghuaihaiense]
MDGLVVGLGLSVVRAIAKAHNGLATYKASATGGSIFEIILPLNGVNDAAIPVDAA